MRRLLAMLVALQVVALHAQTDTTRKLWDTALLAKKTYRVATPAVPVAGVVASRVVGVTIWKLRAPAASDSGERLLVHQGTSSEEWVPTRVAPDARWQEGDRVRLGIEAAGSGYLYVVDREQYADGKVGDPYLIFPTRLTRGGDNSVGTGTVVDIPSQSDDPPYFRLRRSRPDQVGEVLTVIMAPAPIESLEIGDGPLLLPHEQFASWVKAWGGQVGRIDMQGSVGQSWSRAEKEAGLGGTRALSVAEPRPQSVYYRPGGKSDEPVLLSLELRYLRQ
jgi:hypothetical protein